MERHPLSSVWPDMESQDKRALRDDILANGVRDTIVILDGMVLDGWHRYTAAVIAGVNCPMRDFDPEVDGDPVAFVISKNDLRRHISKQQRAKAVRLCLEWQISLEIPDAEAAEIQEDQEIVQAQTDQDSQVLEQAAAETPEIPEVPEPPSAPETIAEEPEAEAPRTEPTHREVADMAGVSMQTARRAAREIAEERGEEITPEKPYNPSEKVAELKSKLDNSSVIQEAQAERIQELSRDLEVSREREGFMEAALEPEVIEEVDVLDSQRKTIEELTADNAAWKASHEEQRKVIESLRAENRSLRRRVAEFKELEHDNGESAD